MRRSYRIATGMISPLLPLWLGLRAARGKEDRARVPERFGHASVARPTGTLVWLHAASVGEANSVLLLIAKLRERFPARHITAHHRHGYFGTANAVRAYRRA